MTTAAGDQLNLGIELANQGNIDEAMIAFGRAIQENPNYAKAYNNLGMMFRAKGQLPEAEAFLQRAIALDPDDAVGYNNLGLIYLDLFELTAAEKCLQQALVLVPDKADFYNNLGLVYEEKNDCKLAEEAYRKAIALRPDYAEAYLNLGIFLKNILRLAEAEQCLKQAIEIRHGYQQAIFALATLYLLQGHYNIGWELYEAFRERGLKRRIGDIPLWCGEDIENARLLIFFEQGYGDTIQFVRYISSVTALAGEVVLWIQPPLYNLLASSYSKLTIYSDKDLPAGQYDFAVSLMSLPKLFAVSDDNIRDKAPYIQPFAATTLRWRRKLEASCQAGQKKVGIVWAGNPKHPNDRNRTIQFTAFKSILEVSNISWINLQVGKRVEDIVQREYKVLDYSAELHDFAETAGLIANLDLVITVDSAVAHLAGAVGKKVWLLLPFFPDWRWQLNTENTPWYPAMRLFRQPAKGEWQGVIEKVKAELQTFRNL